MPHVPDTRTSIKLVKILWNHYCSHGILLLKDIKPLTGKTHYELYNLFQKHNVDAPPVWDSHKEKTRRKAILLMNEAERLKQIFLTKKQAAMILKIKPNQVSGAITQIKKYDFNFPEILVKIPEKSDYLIREEERESEFRMNGRINYRHHPTGLIYSEALPGPTENEITYHLR